MVQVSAGSSHSLALQAGGQVWGWGNNDTGQLGDGTRIRRLTPIRMPLFSTATQVAAGSSFSVMLVAGQPLQWGEATACAFGDDLPSCPIPDDSPHFAAIQLFGVRQISAGHVRRCGLTHRRDRVAVVGAIPRPAGTAAEPAALRRRCGTDR